MRAVGIIGILLYPTPEELHLQVDEVTFDAGRTKMLDRSISFDGVFCATDWLALGALSALKERGIPVPGEVKIIGFDDITPASLASKPLTTIRRQVWPNFYSASNRLLICENISEA